MIETIYIQKEPSISTNVNHNVTDFKLGLNFHEMLSTKAAYLKDRKWLFDKVKNFLTWAWKKNILRKHNFLAEVTFKGYNIVLQEKVEISEVFSLTSNFGRSCSLRCKNHKKLTETKT